MWTSDLNAARRQFEFDGNEEQQIVLEIAEQLLRLVQHLDQSILPELMLLHVDFQNLESLVAAGMLQHGLDPFFLRLGNAHIHSINSFRWTNEIKHNLCWPPNTLLVKKAP